ncbi:MAG: hypothetical protein U1F11_03580 [Steroidobacteraceae bacterium]
MFGPRAYRRSGMEVAFPDVLQQSRPRVPQAPRFGTVAWAGFYLLAPLLMALPLGWYGAGLAAELPFAASMMLWGSICVLSWALSDLIARGLARVLSPTMSVPWLLLVLGYVINMAASSVYNPAVVEWLLAAGFAARTPMVVRYFEVDRNLLDPDYLRLLYVSGFPGLLFWLAGNYIFELVSGVPRFRDRPRGAQPVHGAASTFAAAPTFPAAPARLRRPLSLPLASRCPKVAPPRFLQRLTRLATSPSMSWWPSKPRISLHQGAQPRRRTSSTLPAATRNASRGTELFGGPGIHRSAWVTAMPSSASQAAGATCRWCSTASA